MIEKGREYWKKVNQGQKSVMSHMGMDKVIEVQPDGHVLFEAEGQRFIVEPSGEVISGGTLGEPQPADKVVHAWEQATPDKRLEWLQGLHLPLMYRHKHWFQLRQSVKNILTKDYFLGRPATMPYIRNPQYEKTMTDLAKWYVEHKRSMTEKEAEEMLPRYFPTAEELDTFTDYLASPEGRAEFGKLLRLHGWKAGIAGPMVIPQTGKEAEYFVQTVRGIPDELLLGAYKVPPSAF